MFVLGTSQLDSIAMNAVEAGAKKKFTGKAIKFEAALQKAIALATREITIPDATVQWKLISVTGISGTWVHTIEVTIETMKFNSKLIEFIFKF